MRFFGRPVFEPTEPNPGLGPGTYFPRRTVRSDALSGVSDAFATISDMERRSISTSFSMSRGRNDVCVGPATYNPRVQRTHGQKLTLVGRYSNPSFVWSKAACGYERDVAFLPDPQQYYRVNRRKPHSKAQALGEDRSLSTPARQQQRALGPGSYTPRCYDAPRSLSINAADRHMFLYLNRNPFLRDTYRSLEDYRRYAGSHSLVTQKTGFTHGRQMWQSKFGPTGWKSAEEPSYSTEGYLQTRCFRRRGRTCELDALY